jgi:hypothetical protein
MKAGKVHEETRRCGVVSFNLHAPRGKISNDLRCTACVDERRILAFIPSAWLELLLCVVVHVMTDTISMREIVLSTAVVAEESFEPFARRYNAPREHSKMPLADGMRFICQKKVGISPNEGRTRTDFEVEGAHIPTSPGV